MFPVWPACNGADGISDIKEVKEAKKNVRDHLAAIGKRGGLTSRRDLTRSHAKQMVAIREPKRAALKAGKPWLPRDRRLLKLR